MCVIRHEIRVFQAACVQCGVIALFLLVPSFSWAADDKDAQAATSPAARDPASNLRRPQDDNVPGPLGQRKRFSGDMTLVGGQATDNGPTPNGPREIVEFQQRLEELQKAQQQFASEYQKAMKELQESLPRTLQIDIKRQEAKQKLDAAQAEMAAISIAQSQAMGSPLPDNAAIGAFTLKYVRPEEIGQALHNITGGGGPRIAVDERTNTLLIAGNPKQMDVAQQLVKTLDQPGKSQIETAETLQVRIVWLLDGVDGREPAVRLDTGSGQSDSFVSSQVVDALALLGFEKPGVVCQQLSTLTVGAGNRGSDFHFQVPTLIKGEPWQLEGQGKITLTPDDRYAMQFNIEVTQPNNSQRCQVGGSIVTPLDHYTVLGTTTFVCAETKSEEEGPRAEHLSAFVVYIDRAKEFASGISEEKSKEPGKTHGKR